jgi:LL-diaminopimelate aminotransferase
MDILLSKRLAKSSSYVFDEVDRQVAALRAKGVHVIDFGVGDPKSPTPEFVLEALAKGAKQEQATGYPSYIGARWFREACAAYLEREYGVTVDAETEVMSTIGSKEAVFHFPLGILDPGDVVICPTPGYPPYKTGTRFAGGTPYFVPLLPENQFLIDLARIPNEICRKARIIWTNYPNSPTGAIAPRAWLEELAGWARRHNIVIAADEGCYCDLWFTEKPLSMLQVARDGVIAFYSLSKRSNMTGYRVGFCAGDRRLIGALRSVKTNIDSGTPTFIQRAAVAALADQTHVEALRREYEKKRAIILPALAAAGLPACPGAATFYLWQRAPDGMTGMELAKQLLDAGIVVTPGVGISDALEDGTNPGDSYVRFALVPDMDEVEEAARRIRAMNPSRMAGSN